MTIDYSTPDYIKKAVERIDKELSNFNEECDGFDAAYTDGVVAASKALEPWDFGLSESYIKGLEHALAIYNEEKNKST